MRRNFYFKTQAEIVSGSANFAAIVSADPLSLGLSASQAAEYVACDAALQSAYLAGVNPDTRTSVAVRIMNDAIQLVQREAQRLAKIISATPTVSDARLLELRLLPRATYTRRPAPATQPMLQVISVVGRVVRIRVRPRSPETGARTSGGRRAIGAVGAQVYSFVGEHPPTDSRAYQHEGLATRGRYEVVFPNDVAGGATAWISAAWVSNRGVTGAACAPVRLTVQGGPVQPAGLTLTNAA